VKREHSVRLLHLLVWLVVVAISLLAKTEAALPAGTATVIGLLVFISGLSLFAWAVAYLRTAALGVVEPVSEELVMVGPYKYLRHPLSLGVIVSLVGLAISLRSLWGVLAAIVLFVPVSMYRARLEETAMARRFASQWHDYASRTYFMFPPVH
jgi:protein-S-isoprenylcysteine O-methyltransferase Ste14